jgi:hypothetical protein
LDDDVCSVIFESQEIIVSEDGKFDLRLVGDPSRADVFLTIDIYDFDNPVHPAGHIGWWRFPVEAIGQRGSGHLRVRSDHVDVLVGRECSEDHWVNEGFRYPERSIVSAVLRSKASNAIASLDQIPAFATKTVRSEFRS